MFVCSSIFVCMNVYILEIVRVMAIKFVDNISQIKYVLEYGQAPVNWWKSRCKRNFNARKFIFRLKNNYYQPDD